MIKPLSRIIFGTAMAPLMREDASAEELLDSVWASGINAFDCARSYGRAENTLGKWMERCGNRGQVVVLTKCGDIREGVVKVDRQVIMSQLCQSLDAMRTDYVDFFLLHRDDPDTPLAEIIDTMNEMKEEGKISAFGASNWTHQRIREANAYASAHGLAGFEISSPNYGLAIQVQDPFGGGCVTLSGPENREARAWYAANRMPVIAWSSLGRGFFSGRFRAGDEKTARVVLDPFAQKGYLYPENMERLRRAEILAEREGVTVAEIAMRYVFSSEMNLYAVVSTASIDRLRMNLRASCTPLAPGDVAFLEA